MSDIRMGCGNNQPRNMDLEHRPTTLGHVPISNTNQRDPDSHLPNMSSVGDECVGGAILRTAHHQSKYPTPTPPAVDGAKFVRLKRDFNPRRDLYWYIGDSKLPFATGLRVNPPIGKSLAQFARDNRANPASRTIQPNFISVLCGASRCKCKGA